MAPPVRKVRSEDSGGLTKAAATATVLRLPAIFCLSQRDWREWVTDSAPPSVAADGGAFFHPGKWGCGLDGEKNLLGSRLRNSLKLRKLENKKPCWPSASRVYVRSIPIVNYLRASWLRSLPSV
jgi:hypothetical protein